MYGSYTGGRYDRRQTQNWYATQGSADADTLIDIPTLRARSRDLIRNAPIAAGAIHTVVANAVGTGLALQPTPDITVLGWTEDQSITWSSMVGHEFNLWAESINCDVTRTQNFYQMQSLVMRAALESGDCFALLPMKQLPGSIYKTRIQIVEADRIHTPNGADGMLAVVPLTNTEGTVTRTPNGNKIFGGVEVDAYGAPVAYCILKQHPGAIGFGLSNLFEYDRVPAFGVQTGRRNVIHVFDRIRPDQNRGVPYLAPVMEAIKQLDRYAEAELMAAVITAAFTIFIKTDTGTQGFGQELGTPQPIQQDEITLGNGKVVGLAPGEDVAFPNAMRPNAGFDPFVTSILRQVGVALQLPFEILIKHFTSSYSAARAALLEAWKFYRNRRAFLATSFCQPVFEAWMDEAVSSGRIAAAGYFSDPMLRRAYLSCDWVGDAPGQIDPMKEVAAAQERVNLGVSNRKIETMELTGRNWSDVHRQLTREHEDRVAAGLEPAVTNAVASEMVTAPGVPPSPPPAPNTPAPPGKKGGKP